MISSISTANNMSQLFRQQSQQLSNVMGQVASGRRFARPSDDFVSFMRINRRESDVSGRQTMQDELVIGRQQAQIVRGVAGEALELLGEFRGLIEQRANVPTADSAALNTRLNVLGTQIGNLITNNNNTGGIADIMATRNISTGAGATQQIAMTFTTPTGTALTDATTLADVDTAIAAWGTVSAQAGAFDTVIGRQMTINSNIMAANREAAEAIGAVDEMSAMAQMASLAVRQQATVAMASQANISQTAMLRLFA
ncbi:MAG: hypothetical protein FWE23_02620 [Chitinivibrionia bacterium]|jgi:flagellin-like hook-associated protein FlgL|nr:hypothetical protein [Chitinivibrionia bacterium]